MMSSERVGGTRLDSLPPLSPELCLGTMSTADMFDTNWDSSSGVDSGLSSLERWSPLPSPLPPESGNTLTLWDAEVALEEDLLESNLENIFEAGGLGQDLAGVDLPLLHDLSFLHDTASSMSDVSSSSSTITSYSIPQSPGDISALLENPTLLEESSLSPIDPYMSSDSEETQATEYSVPNALHSAKVPETFRVISENICTSNKKQCVREHLPDSTSPLSQKRVRRIPLATASQVPHNPSKAVNSRPPSAKQLSPPPLSPPHHYKVSAKENGLSLSKKKVQDILDSSTKWSDLSGSEQWMVGEGLSGLLAHSLGVRERLDVLSLLHTGPPEDPAAWQDVNPASLLDDDTLDAVRRYLRTLEDEKDATSQKRFHKRKYRKMSRKHRTKESAVNTKSLARENPRVASSSKGSDRVSSRSGKTSRGKGSSSLAPAGHEEEPKRDGKREKKAYRNSLQAAHRTRKEHRQLLKEKRSGLFEREVVMCLSAPPSAPPPSHHLSRTSHGLRQSSHKEEEEEDVDILG